MPSETESTVRTTYCPTANGRKHASLRMERLEAKEKQLWIQTRTTIIYFYCTREKMSQYSTSRKTSWKKKKKRVTCYFYEGHCERTCQTNNNDNKMGGRGGRENYTERKRCQLKHRLPHTTSVGEKRKKKKKKEPGQSKHGVLKKSRASHLSHTHHHHHQQLQKKH